MNTADNPSGWIPEGFAGRNLVGWDFSRRNLVGADFSGSDCRGCDFSGSDLSMANFTGADLYSANFSGSVLYVAQLGSANLTRADFRGAYVYGFLFSSSAVITYADLREFKLEERRRSVVFRPEGESDYEVKGFGDEVPDVGDVCRSNYRVNRYHFSFRELGGRESNLQQAQVFNLLKRLYRENHDGRAALECHYKARYHLTRSRYKRTVLTAQIHGDQSPTGRTHAALSYLAEIAIGYGVRPRRIFGSLALLFVLFLFTTWMVAAGSTSSGVTYSGPGVIAGRALGAGGSDALRMTQFAALSLVNPELNQFAPYGWMIPLSLLYFAVSACLLALLFSSLFVMILSE